ncbi:MAG: rod shape-determining protein MreC [Spirochaetales bacterium]|nr:rod shape-determining protein MreC [Spirochaetales bacterium]
MRRFKGFFSRFKNIIGLIIFLGISLCFTAFSGAPAVKFAQSAGFSVVSFFQGIFSGIGNWVSGTVNSLGEIDSIRTELADSQKQLIEFQKTSQDNLKLREENERLKRELQLIEKYISVEYISVEIIAWASENDFSTLIVNKGNIHGIKKDMPVVAFQGGIMGLVGKTSAVGLQSSTIQTILDPRSYVGALFKDTRYKGLVNGCGAPCDYIEMDLVSKRILQELDSGMIVVTSGLGHLFPKDIIIGRWKENYITKDYESIVKLQIEPVLDFRRLEYLYILNVEDVN